MKTPARILPGTAHSLPADFRAALAASAKAHAAWESLTPLARNEWICWVVTVKRQETRAEHIKRAVAELREGKRRPCCWMGCIHRTDKKISPSVRYVLDRKAARKR